MPRKRSAKSIKNFVPPNAVPVHSNIPVPFGAIPLDVENFLALANQVKGLGNDAQNRPTYINIPLTLPKEIPPENHDCAKQLPNGDHSKLQLNDDHTNQLPTSEHGKRLPLDYNSERIAQDVIIQAIKKSQGWVTYSDKSIPYIERHGEKYLSVRIVETQLLNEFPQLYPDEILREAPLMSVYMTEEEAIVFTRLVTDYIFTTKDVLVPLTDFRKFYFKLLEVFAKLDANQCQQLAKKPKVQSGWVQINNTVIPFITRDAQRFVPLSIVRYAAGLLTDVPIFGEEPTPEECLHLNRACIDASISFTFNSETKLIRIDELFNHYGPKTVKLVELPSDDPFSHTVAVDIFETDDSNGSDEVFPKENISKTKGYSEDNHRHSNGQIALLPKQTSASVPTNASQEPVPSFIPTPECKSFPYSNTPVGNNMPGNLHIIPLVQSHDHVANNRTPQSAYGQHMQNPTKPIPSVLTAYNQHLMQTIGARQLPSSIPINSHVPAVITKPVITSPPPVETFVNGPPSTLTTSVGSDKPYVIDNQNADKNKNTLSQHAAINTFAGSAPIQTATANNEIMLTFPPLKLKQDAIIDALTNPHPKAAVTTPKQQNIQLLPSQQQQPISENLQVQPTHQQLIASVQQPSVMLQKLPFPYSTVIDGQNPTPQSITDIQTQEQPKKQRKRRSKKNDEDKQTIEKAKKSKKPDNVADNNVLDKDDGSEKKVDGRGKRMYKPGRYGFVVEEVLDNKISCIIRKNGIKFSLLEAAHAVFFAKYDFNLLIYVLKKVLRVPVDTLSRSEERAFIDFYGLPIEALHCSIIISLSNLRNNYERVKLCMDEEKAKRERESIQT